MSTRLKGKTALVTGAGRGIGKAIALRLAADGANVVINYRSDPESAQAVVDEIAHVGQRAIAIRADVSDPQQVVELFKQARRFARLDIVCSNAGIEHFGPLEAITAEDFDRVFHTNTLGQLLIAQQAAAALKEGGAIVSERHYWRVSTHPLRGKQGSCRRYGAAVGGRARHEGHTDQCNRARRY